MDEVFGLFQVLDDMDGIAESDGRVQVVELTQRVTVAGSDSAREARISRPEIGRPDITHHITPD